MGKQIDRVDCAGMNWAALIGTPLNVTPMLPKWWIANYNEVDSLKRIRESGLAPVEIEAILAFTRERIVYWSDAEDEGVDYESEEGLPYQMVENEEVTIIRTPEGVAEMERDIMRDVANLSTSLVRSFDNDRAGAVLLPKCGVWHLRLLDYRGHSHSYMVAESAGASELMREFRRLLGGPPVFAPRNYVEEMEEHSG
jgi:hypothetical protein